MMAETATSSRLGAAPTTHSRPTTRTGSSHSSHSVVGSRSHTWCGTIPASPVWATPVVGEPHSAQAAPTTRTGSSHTTVGGRSHTLAGLVWAARLSAPIGAGACLIVGGLYSGPACLVPAPVLLALAALGWSAQIGGGQ